MGASWRKQQLGWAWDSRWGECALWAELFRRRGLECGISQTPTAPSSTLPVPGWMGDLGVSLPILWSCFLIPKTAVRGPPHMSCHEDSMSTHATSSLAAFGATHLATASSFDFIISTSREMCEGQGRSS